MGEVECGTCLGSGRIKEEEYDGGGYRKCLNCTGTGTRPAKVFKWTVEISISEIWVADGFDLTEERLRDMVASHLGYACHNEIAVRVVKAPEPAAIAKAQGF